MLIGSVLIVLVLAAFCVIGYKNNDESDAQSFLLLAYCCVYGFSLGSVVWLYAAEILSDKMLSVAFMCNWIAGFAVAEGFPYLNDKLEQYYVFGIFGLFSLFTALFIAFNVPETMGKSEGEIKDLFDRSRKTTNIQKILKNHSELK